MVGVSLLEESHKVVYQWLHVVLDAASDDHNVLHVRVVLLVAVIIVVAAGYSSDPLRTPLPPLLASLDILHGALDGDAGRHHLATAGDRFPVA
jgi:hypothetical protein